MGALDWMEWFGWQARAAQHRTATTCPCLDCGRLAAHRAGWTAIGAAFRTIAYCKWIRWQVERDRIQWASLTSPVSPP